MSKTQKPTARQVRFAEEYLIDLNATQACIRAGYSARNADKIGPQLLGKVRVATLIAEAKSKRTEETRVTAGLVLTRLAEILDADLIEIMDDHGNFKPVQQWPKIWRQMISGCDVEEVWEGRGDSRSRIGTITKIRFIDRLKTIELVGKHTDVGAFIEKIQHQGDLDINVKVEYVRPKKDSR